MSYIIQDTSLTCMPRASHQRLLCGCEGKRVGGEPFVYTFYVFTDDDRRGRLDVSSTQS